MKRLFSWVDSMAMDEGSPAQRTRSMAPSQTQRTSKNNSNLISMLKSNASVRNKIFQMVGPISEGNLNRFARCSKDCQALILKYLEVEVTKSSFLQSTRLEDMVKAPQNIKKKFVDLGRLLKSATAGNSMSVQKRMELAFDFLKRINSHLDMNGLSINNVVEILVQHFELPHLNGFDPRFEGASQMQSWCAVFVTAFTTGWSIQEKRDAIQHFTFMNSEAKEAVDKILSASYILGTYKRLEFAVRQQFQNLFWNEIPQDSKGFWLQTALECFAGAGPTKQALLLFLVFGPTRDVSTYESFYGIKPAVLGGSGLHGPNIDRNRWLKPVRLPAIMWNEVKDPVVYPTKERMENDFYPLANALSMIHQYRTSIDETIDGKVNLGFFPALPSRGNQSRMTKSQPQLHDTHQVMFVDTLFDLSQRIGFDVTNIATLLLLSSKDFRAWYLSYRLVVSSDSSEVSDIFTDMLVKAAQFAYDVEPIITLMTFLIGGIGAEEENWPYRVTLKENQKNEFIEGLWSGLFEHLQDHVHEDAETNGVTRAPIMAMITELGNHILKLAYSSDTKPASEATGTYMDLKDEDGVSMATEE